MADLSSSIFNKKATEKLRSPDDLDKYVKVTTPSIWIVLIAGIFLLAGLAAWGFLGAVTTNLSTMAVAVDGQAMCFLSASDVGEVSVGDKTTIDGKQFTVSEIAAVPLSRGEAEGTLHSDYLVDTLIQNDWGYQVTFDGPVDELPESVPLSVDIEVDRVAPISLIMKNWG